MLGVATAAVLQLRFAGTYWDYSEGVYLETSRLFLHGRDLYSQVVAAQPPPLFLFGAGALGVHDALASIRLAVALVEVVAALLAGLLVLRLSGSRLAAVASVPLFFLTPWTLREYGTLIPELLAPPLLLAGVLLAPRAGAGRGVGAIAAVLAFTKAPFVLPAAALVLVARDRRTAAVWGAATLALLSAAALAVFGTDLWTDVVRAQLQTGRAHVSDVAGVWAQAGWNELGLLVAALLAWRFRRTLDAPLLRSAAAVAGATLLTFLSIFKNGTSLSVLVPVEAVLLPLAVAGAAAGLRAARAAASLRAPGRGWAAVAVVALVFPIVQALALVAEPRVHGGHPFLRPGSTPRYGINLTRSGVDAAADVARACPPNVPYSGPPFVAFVAGRSMPAGQPDAFLVAHASVLSRFRAAVEAVGRRCPASPPPIP